MYVAGNGGGGSCHFPNPLEFAAVVEIVWTDTSTYYAVGGKKRREIFK